MIHQVVEQPKVDPASEPLSETDKVPSPPEPAEGQFSAFDLGLDESPGLKHNGSSAAGSAVDEDKGEDSPAEEKAETESDHYMEMYVDGQIKEKVDPLEERLDKLAEELKNLTDGSGRATKQG